MSPVTRALFIAAVLLCGGESLAHAESSTVEQCADDAEQSARLIQQGAFDRARVLVARCVRDACPSVLRRDCGDLAVRMDREQPTIVVRVTLDGKDCRARITLDGQPRREAAEGLPLRLDPGEHKLGAECEEGGSQDLRVVVRAGEQLRTIGVPIQSPRSVSAPRKGPPPASWVLGGLGAAAVLTGAGFGVAALGEVSDLNRRCKAGECSDDDAATYKRYGYLADGLIFGGLTLVAAGALLWLLHPSAAPRATSNTPPELLRF